ncbi:MAG: DUF3524 domain-containing protein [Planctomycetes bacterium]|nr:DUF3524 domain-containing protein [Planctomycetota bacterium]
MSALRVLYVEPFDGGAHAAFGDALAAHGGAAVTRLSLPARAWKWRMRGAGLWLAERHRAELEAPHDVLLCSSFTPLADLVALVPALVRLPKVVYFHENQWQYPVREREPRDHHFGFTQLVSAAVADLCLFNSRHNLATFLGHCQAVVDAMPDARPRATVRALAARSEVFPVPVELPAVDAAELREVPPGPARAAGPHILWSHRWEHDKDPDTFFAVLRALHARGCPFRLLVCGERYDRAPAVFEAARQELADRIDHFGFAATRADYEALLRRAQIAVSTALHEFFGIAMLEATHAGALPLVPDRLAYPELFPREYRYRDATELTDRLAAACRGWVAGAVDLRGDRRTLTERYDARVLAPTLIRRLAVLHQLPR